MKTLALASDRLDRPLGVLRLSLTARCNLACTYCCPTNEESDTRLTLAAQLAVIRAACALGARCLRLTGGEPLLSDRLEPLLQAVTAGRADPKDPLSALRDVALTSNGMLLSKVRAQQLRRLGLDRITISLDGVHPERVGQMAGRPEAGARVVDQVLAGLNNARSAGFDPLLGQLKLNSVIQKDVNDDQVVPLAAFARELGVELRLIEYMDVGQRNGWEAEQVMPAAEMLRLIGHQWPLEPLSRAAGSTSSRWRYRDQAGVVGVIASITQPFCGDCNRLRITADGIAYTCLFASQGTDLRTWLMPVVDPMGLRDALGALWKHRSDRYSEERGQANDQRSRPDMAYLGG